MYSYSDVESKRFQMNVHRYRGSELNHGELKKYILENDVDLLILRLPVEEKEAVQKLSKLGFPIIHADNLVYYSVELQKTEISPLKNDLNFVEVTPENMQVLQDMIPLIFKGYKNHYSSNPYLDRKKISEGYIEWACSYMYNMKDKIAWLVKKGEQHIGFATCAFDYEKSECEGVLYGVHPDFSGGGVYSDIIRYTQRYFKEKNFSKMIVSTQIQNLAVQKVWARENFRIAYAFDTYHINSFLQCSISKSFEEEFNISQKDVIEFANFSGDKNPLHLDEKFAISAGFEKTITHGMLINDKVTKFLGMDFPGPGTIFLDNSTLYLKPIYANENYKLVINCPWVDNAKGIYHIVAKVIGSKGTCLVSYNTVMKK